MENKKFKICSAVLLLQTILLIFQVEAAPGLNGGSFNSFVEQFDKTYTKVETNLTKSEATHEKICEQIKSVSDRELVNAVEIIQNIRGYSQKYKDAAKEGILNSAGGMEKIVDIMCNMKKNSEDWEDLKTALNEKPRLPHEVIVPQLEKKFEGTNPALEQNLKRLEIELAENDELQKDLQKKLLGILEAEVDGKYKAFRMGLIKWNELSGEDKFNMIGKLSQDGLLPEGGPFTNRKSKQLI